MKTSEVIGSVNFQLTAGLQPWDSDPYEYVMKVTGRIRVSSGDSNDDAPAEDAGEMELFLLSLDVAYQDGVHPFDLFDARSQTLAEVYQALFDADGNTREDLLTLPPLTSNMFFISGLSIDPKFATSDLARQVVLTAMSVFASVGLVVALSDLPLSIDEWLQLGFKRIAGHARFVYRDQSEKNPYGRN